jgi:hypothetical protein
MGMPVHAENLPDPATEVPESWLRASRDDVTGVTGVEMSIRDPVIRVEDRATRVAGEEWRSI